MKADIIRCDFVNRTWKPEDEDQSLEHLANVVFAQVFPIIYPDFSSAAAYHAPEKDPA